MCLVFVPDYTGGNPYQSNLAAALDEEVVLGGKGGTLPVVRALWSYDVSVVHYHWVNQYFHGDSRWERAVSLAVFAVQLLAVRLSNVTVVWTVHNVRLHESPHPRLERRFKRWFVRSGTCDRLIVHCERVVDAVVDEYDLSPVDRDRIDVIPHGHYLDNYENDVSVAEAREELGIDGSVTVFLFFGLIRRYKGVFDLVSAFQDASIPESRLLIAGNPRTRAIERELDRQISEDERITGVFEFVPDEEIQYYMNAADVVVLPFRETTTSGSAVLAMSFGRGVVVPRLGCLPELVDEAGAVSYGPDRPGGLADALRAAATRNTTAMGEHNLERVGRFDWESVARMTERTYARAA
jgi:glycosyltransferase involved in cell wall biosynthesis